MIFEEFLIFITFLCWGSFLNVLGHRIVHEHLDFLKRSHCPSCEHALYWYDLIPLISFLLRLGKCRYCHQAISFLYPIIEIITALSLFLLYWFFPFYLFLAYFFYFSLLIVTIRSDLEHLLVSSWVTLYTVPIPIVLSYLGYLPIPVFDSFFGALSGYFCLWSIGKLFFWWTHKEGIGEGDFEVMALIGAWTGMLGCWFSLTLGSIIGVISGIMMQTYQDAVDIKIPFAPCLAAGSMIFVFYAKYIVYYLF
jgi:prepilin signal peptidase PulO-like enzyme (type II secretory pathway)